MPKHEAFSLFKEDLVLLGRDENRAEREHLLYVVALAAAKVIVRGRPIANSFAKFIPRHHHHENSEKKVVPAITFIVKPYPYQETQNSDTIKLLVRLQRKFLKSVAKSRGDDPEFLRLLEIYEDENVSDLERELAEKLVIEAVLEHGVWIVHGDLLTVKMVLEAKKLMSGSATAFGRLEFLLGVGPFRRQLLHMKKGKTSQDYAQGMIKLVNFNDVLSIPWSAALC